MPGRKYEELSPSGELGNGGAGGGTDRQYRELARQCISSSYHTTEDICGVIFPN